MESSSVPWAYFPDFWPTTADWDGQKRSVYDLLLAECKPHMTKGHVVLYGNVHQESRYTCLFSNETAKMKYSGRIVEAHKPQEGTYMWVVFESFKDPSFRAMMLSEGIDIPDFNAVFVNWYPAPEKGISVPGLGPHSDLTKDLTSEVIFSITFCEKGGARLFSFLNKESGKVVWEKELQDGDAIVMLKGCQSKYKHSVAAKKTNSAGKITGGRINLTLRALKLE